jgi:DNA-binding response OmpR family regulator
MSKANNTLRLDEILLRQGAASEEEIREALEYQREHGGRIGSHLIRLGFVTEEQLLRALARQFDSQSVLLSQLEIPPEVIQLIPAEVATARTVIPFEYDQKVNTLSVACEDPTDESLLDELLFVTHDKNIRLYVAAEMSLRAAIARYYVASGQSSEASDHSDASEQDAEGLEDDIEAENQACGAVLVVSDDRQTDLLVATALEQEGYTVIWTDNADDAIDFIGGQKFHAVFIRDTVPGDYIDLIDRLRKVSPSTVVRYYESAGRILLQESGYDQTGDLLDRNMQLFTTLLASRNQVSGNHAAVMGRYVDKLCREIGLPAKDRLSVVNAAYLHDISRYYYGESKSAPDCRTRVKMTAKLLDSLNFPPLVVGILEAMFIDLKDKYTRRLPIEKLGGNILTIVDVFCEHASFDKRMSLDKFDQVRNNLVSLSGRLFLKEVTLAFIRVIEREILVEPVDRDTAFNQVLMYCEDDDYLAAIAGRLKEEGFRPVSLTDVDKFVEMYQRSRPNMIILLQEGQASRSRQLISALTKKGVEFDKVPTFLVAANQATPELANMLELGLEDVIPIENSLDLLVVKLHKLRDKNADTDIPEPSEPDPAVTSGNLEDISLVDLLQAMGPGGKTARIKVSSDGSQLVMYLDKGKVVYAEGDDKRGAEAFYDGVAWKTGQWTVRSIDPDKLPEPNNDADNDALLMEGCRRLDEESRANTRQT